MKTLSKLKTRYLAMAAAGALGLCLAVAPAAAQDDGYVDDPAYDQEYDDAGSNNVGQGDIDDAAMSDDEAMEETASDDEAMDNTATGDSDGEQVASAEEVVVSAPPIRAERGPQLRPHRYSMTRGVSFADLDLQTRDGARELRARVRDVAGQICDELSTLDPADDSDAGTCYRESVRNGLVRANAAIVEARTYAYR